MLKEIYTLFKLIVSIQNEKLQSKLLKTKLLATRMRFRLEVYQNNISLESEMLKEKLNLKRSEFVTKNRKSIIKDFDSGNWNGREGADSSLDSQIEEYQIKNNFKYKREIDRWNVGGDAVSKDYPFCKRAKVLFGDQLVEILDPKDEVMNLFIEEASNLIPNLLVHPDERLRAVAQKYIKKDS